MKKNIQGLRAFIEAARGIRPADLVLKNARVVNVLAGAVHEADVALFRGRIVGLGDYRGLAEMDLGGAYLAPGLIDGHVHVESSLVPPAEYAKAVVPRGTTAIIMDPHEIANVLGIPGIRFMLASGRGGPLSIYVMLPSCVPATDLETSGARLSASDLEPLLRRDKVLGLAELMDYPGVLWAKPLVLEKVWLGRRKRVDGHAPGLTGKDLCAYTGAGIRSDHECTSQEEAEEKLRLGMFVMIREGSTAKNLEALLPAVKPQNAWRFLLVSDDRSPVDLCHEGHMDHILRKAVSLGLDAITAIQMATINTASYFRLDDLGAVAPGFQADLVVLEDLKAFRVLKVFKAGRLVAEEGRLLPGWEESQDLRLPPSMNVKGLGPERLSIKAEGDWIKVIELIPGQILNRLRIEKAKVERGVAVPDPDRDLLKLTVIERHRATGNVGLGFAKGFGLKRGALGSSFAHDSHNIIAVGTDDQELAAAVSEVERMGGGLVVVAGGTGLASLPLPLAGLMSDRPLAEVTKAVLALREAAKGLGCVLDDPFMALSFLALPVIPELRLTDQGLVDVRRSRFVPLFGDA